MTRLAHASKNSPLSLTFQVFRIDVLMNGRQHTVEKRYSEFHTLHKLVRVDLLRTVPSLGPSNSEDPVRRRFSSAVGFTCHIRR